MQHRVDLSSVPTLKAQRPQVIGSLSVLCGTEYSSK